MAETEPPAVWQELIGTTLNSAPAEPGGGPGGPGVPGARLKHTKGPWTTASGVAGELRASAQSAKEALTRGHEGVAGEGSGLASVIELDAVRFSWEGRLEDLRKECENLEGSLKQVAKELGESDREAASGLDGVIPYNPNVPWGGSR